MLNVLLLSAYHAQSHAYWCDGLQQHFPDYRWKVLELPARHFAWRVRGNPLSWYQKPELTQNYDLIIATSMVDLATLRGLHPQLAIVPALLYFHENQFAYPLSSEANSQLEAQMVSLYSAISAEKILFNSRYNQQSFFRGLAALLKKLPDHVPAGIIDKLESKSSCLAVPLADDLKTMPIIPPETPHEVQIVWNHRWEYDKGPTQLLNFVRFLPQDLNFKFHILGQNFRKEPNEFKTLKAELQKRDWLGAWGYMQNRQDYLNQLASCNFALSTALHDFQGLALMEAVAYGCTPLAPKRLAYPEFIEKEYLYHSSPEDPQQEAKAAVQHLLNLLETDCKPQKTTHWMWPHLKLAYREVFETLAGLEVSCAARQT